ncbi:polyprenyl synthetase family protein [Oscillospiraceae bacterium HV4-5-C5C]|nr:polyprenyl synthetase family protein [Oscillospiraceae bacterium HV4-5-C5C]
MTDKADMNAFLRRWEAYTARAGRLIEQAFTAARPRANEIQEKIYTAMAYSLAAGGKRLRPVLVFAAADALGLGSDLQTDCDSLALALEMIHTYSLIHDDLPCMDNDDLRRGKPTNHKVYGEAMAVLAGDGLLNSAAEVLLELACRGLKQAHAARVIMQAAGPAGMIGGQVMDMQSEGLGSRIQSGDPAQAKTTEAFLRQLQVLKTGALITAAVSAPAQLDQFSEPVRLDLSEYGRLLGLAFQIEDDMLDVTADPKALGKSTGKDERDGKLTFVTARGLAGAGEILEQTLADLSGVCRRLDRQGLDMAFLTQVPAYLSQRRA